MVGKKFTRFVVGRRNGISALWYGRIVVRRISFNLGMRGAEVGGGIVEEENCPDGMLGVMVEDG